MEKPEEIIKDRGNITVAARGIGMRYVYALAAIADTARRGYREVFGLRMPSRIYIAAEKDPEGPNMLNTDGRNTVYFSCRSDKDLLPPKKSGYSHIFGFSHELGHIAFSGAFPAGFALKDASADMVYQAWADYSAAKRIIPFIADVYGGCPWPNIYDFLAEEGPRHLSGFLKSHASPQAGSVLKLFDAADKAAGPKQVGRLVGTFGRELMWEPEAFTERLKKLAKR